MNIEQSSESSKRSQAISITAARKILGMVGRNYSDADLEEVLRCLYGIAELGFEYYQDSLKQD